MGQPVIQITDLTRYYQMGDTTVKALDGVTFDIHKNEYLAIMFQDQVNQL